jgi:hypothetical protein
MKAAQADAIQRANRGRMTNAMVNPINTPTGKERTNASCHWSTNPLTQPWVLNVTALAIKVSITMAVLKANNVFTPHAGRAEATGSIARWSSPIETKPKGSTGNAVAKALSQRQPKSGVKPTLIQVIRPLNTPQMVGMMINTGIKRRSFSRRGKVKGSSGEAVAMGVFMCRLK